MSTDMVGSRKWHGDNIMFYLVLMGLDNGIGKRVLFLTYEKSYKNAENKF